ncbi:hypothetical protein C8T65DRAFT_749288 [Cerioporus squamosus]|nr:hypothetical protein C8T65DRAFT_749288 [Cerioporus squamosus]
MDCIDFHASPSDAKRFQASGFATTGHAWDITGGYTVDGESGKVTYVFTRIYKSRFDSETFRGSLSSNGTTLLCNWKCGYGDLNFMYKRLSADAMKFWPSPAELDANKCRALWKFACNAVRFDVARRLHSWTWLQQRWENGKEYLRLRHKQALGKLTAEEESMLSGCYRRNTPEEASLYQIFLDVRMRSVPDHFMISCDACGRHIRGGRVMCLSCGTTDTIDLCDKPECCAKVVGTDVRDDLVTPHLPSHDMFKVRIALHSIREFGPAHRAATEALKVARKILEDTVEHDPSSAKPDAQAATETQPEPPRKPPSCVKCGDQVSQPCWFCIDCKDSSPESGGGIFICTACDIKHGGFAADKHKATHALVRVQVQELAQDPAALERAMIDARMNTMEGSLKEMQYKFDRSFVSVDEKVEFVKTRLGLKMDERLGQLEGRMSSMDTRLQRIEDLLLLMGQSLGVASGGGVTRATPSWQPTWPTTATAQTVDASLDSESDFSAWVRRLRSNSM